jgi:Ca-activated chloride channel family protein
MFGNRCDKAKLALTVLVLAAFCPSESAQQKEEIIRIGTDLVVIDATVTDKDGNYIRNLKPEDFIIFEDGEPQELGFFEASEQSELTRPLAVVFALDVSGSIRPEEIARQRVAAENFMRLVRPDSIFAVLAFNNEIRVLQDFTSDPKKISQAFQRIGRAEGATRLFGCIDRAVSMLRRAPRFLGGRRLRRVVVVITDGYDSVDTIDQRDLIARAVEAGVTVYSITLPSYTPGLGTRQRALTLLDASRIVPMTGGTDFSADISDFTPVFRSIAEEIKASYTLAYYPPEKNRHDGRAHQIRVEVKRPGAIVRTSRQSYLAAR